MAASGGGGALAQGTRKWGGSEQPDDLWRQQYGQRAVAEIHRLRMWEEENRKLKPRVADLTLDQVLRQEGRTKKRSSRRATARLWRPWGGNWG